MNTLAQHTRPPAFSALARSSSSEQRRVELSRQSATQAVFLNITETFAVSFVPELFMSMEIKPAYLETAWELFKEDMQLDRLDARTKRMIALALTTNASGHFCITEYPDAFRTNALQRTLCDKIVSTIRFFKAFDRYLSGVMPSSIPDTPTFVSTSLRDEYWSIEATKSSERVPSSEEVRPGEAWISGLLIIALLLWPIALGVYLIVR